MIAGVVLAISFLMLARFFVSYCHSLIAKSRSYELSEQARKISGVAAHMARGDQFNRLLSLIALCPGTGGDANRVRAVSSYFNLLGLARTLLSGVIPTAAQWIEAERGGCAYVAAVVLDRRIAYSRNLLAHQQASNQL
ncbi:MAG: hypothetical protein ABSA96_11260 [Candidatus Acidiferrales bacterium]|jgi:hypothetical protein